MQIYVPQIFYDLIGRLVPGSVLATWILLLFPPLREPALRVASLAKDSEVIALALIFVAGSLCYTTSILIGHLSSVLKCVRKPLHAKFFRPATAWSWPAESADEKHLYEEIQQVFPEAGLRLVKLSAERCFARVLTLGSALILGVYRVYLCFGQDEIPEDVAPVAILALACVGGGSSILYWHVQKRSKDVIDALKQQLPRGRIIH